MPLNRKSPRVFYGWWIVGASFLIALYVGGVVFYGFTAIIEPIADELGWSYTQISFAASLRGLEMSLFAPLTGILVDRWGPKRLIFGGAIFIALGLILLSRTTSLAMFYGAFFLVAIGMSCCTMTVLMAAVANWFRYKVSIASGIAVAGFGFGGVLVPVMVRLIDLYEWRITMIILALGVLVIVLPLSLLFRHKPEQYGYSPDGEPIKEAIILDDIVVLPQTDEVDITAKQALRSRTFWLLALALTFHTLMVTAIITHVIPYLDSVLVGASTYTLVATAVPLMSVGGRLGLGWLGDRVVRKRAAAGAFIMMGLGLICFGYTSGTAIWLLLPFILLFGIGYGGIIALRPSLVREFFGRRSFGTIFGLVMGINMLGGMIGPPLAAWVYDNWGSYQYIWLVFAVLGAVAAILILTAHRVSAIIKPSNYPRP